MWIAQTLLLLTLLFMVSAGQEQQPQVRTESVSIDIYTATLNWTSVPRTIIGSTQLRDVGLESFDIPSVIPSSAKEVLVLADMQVGYSGPPGVLNYVKIFTTNSRTFEKYIVLRSAHQNAWSVNSENMWFPMTAGRRVYIESEEAHNQNLILNLHAIGYL